jgi:hypothetical protein
MSTQAEVFTKDLENFHAEQKHYLDASGNFLGYNPTDSFKLLHTEEQKKAIWDDRTFFRGYGVITDPSCTMDDPTLKGLDAGGKPVGLSNVNFGRIGNSLEIGGKSLEDLGLEWRVLKGTEGKISVLDSVGRWGPIGEEDHVLMKGELTAPLVEAHDEDCSDKETDWHCKGCSKYFATKASLKRHHERKKSCKEISEKPVATATEVPVPDKPYIIDWIDQLMTKAISGDSDKPYCKHCDVEFANKSNLNKHLSKTVACDKLAKQEFMKSIK